MEEEFIIFIFLPILARVILWAGHNRTLGNGKFVPNFTKPPNVWNFLGY